MTEFVPGERALLSHPDVAPRYNNKLVTIVETDGGSYIHTIDGFTVRQFRSPAYVLKKIDVVDEKPISESDLMEVLNG